MSSGKFNAIYKRGQISQNAVYTMKDVISDLSLPVKVRLLFGKAPVVPCIFTGEYIVDATNSNTNLKNDIFLNKNICMKKESFRIFVFVNIEGFRKSI